MKKNIIILLFTLSCLTSCSAQKTISKYFDNKIQQADSESWVAGVRGGGSGRNLTIVLKNKLPKEITLVQVYFSNSLAKPTKISETQYQVSFKGQANWQRNYEPETDGQPKVTTIEPPFKIENNEAILEYTYKNQKRYFKILNIKEKEPLYYPSAKPRN